jgi:hypothetical protein
METVRHSALLIFEECCISVSLLTLLPRQLCCSISPFVDPRTRAKVFFISNNERAEVLGRFMSRDITPMRYGGTYPDGDVALCQRREFVYTPILLQGDGGDDSSDGEGDEFHEVLPPRHFGLGENPGVLW